MHGRRLTRTTFAVAIAAVSGALLASCGGSNYTYVSSRDHNTVLRVPADWTRFEEEALEDRLFGSESATSKVLAATSWTVGFDASEDPEIGNVVGLTASEPVVYMFVREIDPATQGRVSLDALRDLLLPVTETARQAAAQQGQLPEGFELLLNDTVEEGDGLRGVHVSFNYDIGPSLQTFEQKVLVNQETSKIYTLVIHCTASCYTDREDELSDVVDSFTVND